MLLGTLKVSVSSVACTSETAENHLLKVSGLTCGLRARDSFSQSSVQVSSMRVVNNVTELPQRLLPSAKPGSATRPHRGFSGADSNRNNENHGGNPQNTRENA